MHSFDRSFTSEYRLLSRLAVGEGIALVAALLTLVLAPARLHWLSLIIGLIGVVSARAVLAILYRKFRQISIVREKYELLAEKTEHEKNLKRARAEIDKAKRERDRITQDEKESVDKRQAMHERLLDDIERRRSKTDEDERDEVADELRHLQEEHFDQGLRRTPISPDDIKGVGNKTVERLRNHGVQSAADVSVASVQAVPGFGEAKAAAVAEWRSDVERELKATAPQRLPEVHEARIRAKYERLREELAEEESQEHKDLRDDIATIRENARSRHAANDEAETRAREEAQQYEAELEEVLDKLEPYERISFREFLRGSLYPPEGATSRPRLAVLGIGAGLVAGLVCQTAVGLASAGSIYVASLPTSTPTPTATFTPTATGTPTPTGTPTATSTHSVTPLPTATFTPSLTPTPSNTPTPSATVPQIDAAACIPENTKREVAQVVDVIDGDTIDVLIDGQALTVRYIGIDTPEQGDHLFYESLRRNRQYVQGQTVTLIKDVSETDRYDRLLRYVMVGDTFVNYELVRQGFALPATFPPDVACAETFSEAADLARSENRGLYIPTVTPTFTRDVVIVTEEPDSGDCHPSYPDVCIPPPPPDLDCGDISYRRFTVTGTDPHRFDGDNDGIGCES